MIHTADIRVASERICVWARSIGFIATGKHTAAPIFHEATCEEARARRKPVVADVPDLVEGPLLRWLIIPRSGHNLETVGLVRPGFQKPACRLLAKGKVQIPLPDSIPLLLLRVRQEG
jgi:hypothetical protein